MTDREAILTSLRNLQGGSRRPDRERPRPELSTALDEELVQRMSANTASVERLGEASEVPARVARYVLDNAIPPRLVIGIDKVLAALPWEEAGLQVEQRAATADDVLAVSRASCAIAESGTLLLPSGPDNPNSLNFLPDHHIVLLSSNAIVGHWEQAWAYVRQHWQGAPPRSLNFISGPSSTADVGLTQVFGAHGPRNLSVLLLDS